MADGLPVEAPKGIPDPEREDLIARARNIAHLMNELELPATFSFIVDGYTPTVTDANHDSFFRFVGSIENRFRYTNLWGTTAIIKDIKLPEGLRGKGLGRDIVRIWEDAALAQGITDFAVTNPKPETVDYWKKNGYSVPEEEAHKRVPYCMVKRIQRV